MTSITHQLSYGDYLRFRDLILSHSGLYFPEKKRRDLEIGLLKALQDVPLSNSGIDAYYHYLSESGSPDARVEMERLINLLTVGETHFFRNSAQFDALATHVLPDLITHKRREAKAVGVNSTATPQLRLWSAGCATGEEAYSLAILLHELIPDIKHWNILVLATDINRNSLARAREAVYSDWSFREERASRARALYFKGDGKRYQLIDDIRSMVTFARHNLIEDDFPAAHNNTVAMDLIVCRNVTIYFAPETSRKLVEKFHNALTEGSWLVVGHSEPSLTTFRSFQVRTFPKAVLYQKTGQPTLWPDDWESFDAGTNGDSDHPVDRFGTSTSGLLSKWLSSSGQLIDGESNSTRLTKGNSNSLHKTASEESPPVKLRPPRRTSLLPVLASDGTLIPRDMVHEDMDAYERARLHLSRGYISEAVAALEEKLSEMPTFAPAVCLMARSYADLGQWEQARAWCQKAIELDSLLPEAYYIMAMIDEYEGGLEQAIANLKRVIYLERESPLPYFNLAVLYQKEACFKQSRRALNNVIRTLRKWPPERIIPDSGHTSAERLITVAQQMLAQMEDGSDTDERKESINE
jgi:chemotaxis protein methyltransferase CheR